MHPPSILITPHLLATWAEIGIEAEAEAHSARMDGIAASQSPNHRGLGEALVAELKQSVICAIAALHSLEVLYAVLADFVVDSDLRKRGARNARRAIQWETIAESFNRTRVCSAKQIG